MADREALPLVIGQPVFDEAARAWLHERYRVIETKSADEIHARLEQADALHVYLPVRLDRPQIERARRAKVIAVPGSGVDHIDLAAARDHGIIVTHAVGVGALSIAEHVIAQLMAMVKRTRETERALREDRFLQRWTIPMGEISGMTLAVVGYGNIGREVARIAKQGFRMRVIVVTRTGQPVDDANVDETLPLDEALAQADAVSMHVPLNDATRGLIDARAIARMKRGVWFVDTTRGGVTDARALEQALRSGQVAGAAIDVWEPQQPAMDHPLLHAPHVLATPHCAGITAQAFHRLAMAAAHDIDDALHGRRPKGLLDPADWAGSRAAAA